MRKSWLGLAAMLVVAPLGGRAAAADTQLAAARGATTVGVQADPCVGLAPWPKEVVAYTVAVAKARAARQPAPPPDPDADARYQAWADTRLLQDFAGLCRYRKANAQLPPASGQRVIFFGDSITELWRSSDPGFFSGDTLDRGIGGQTTAQMVARFQEDVIALRPSVVHILAGTNDIAGNTGATTLPWIEANVRTMVELAKAHHIKVVLAALLPVERYSVRPAIDPVPSVQALNTWLRQYATAERLTFVDYGPALDNGRHGLRPEFSDDGLHPNDAGYAAMRPLAERALRQTAAQASP